MEKKVWETLHYTDQYLIIMTRRYMLSNLHNTGDSGTIRFTELCFVYMRSSKKYFH